MQKVLELGQQPWFMFWFAILILSFFLWRLLHGKKHDALKEFHTSITVFVALAGIALGQHWTAANNQESWAREKMEREKGLAVSLFIDAEQLAEKLPELATWADSFSQEAAIAAKSSSNLYCRNLHNNATELLKIESLGMFDATKHVLGTLPPELASDFAQFHRDRRRLEALVNDIPKDTCDYKTPELLKKIGTLSASMSTRLNDIKRYLQKRGYI
jgi:hypothetical protein